MQEGAGACYSVGGERFPNQIASVALRRPPEVNHTGSGSYSMLYIELLLTAALLSMIINHGIQHWPQEVPGQLSICCIAGIQSQCFKDRQHGCLIKVQVKQMQFFTKMPVFGNNIKWIQKRKIYLMLKNLWSQFFTALQYEGTLYLLYTDKNDYQECKAKENQASK